MPKYNKTFAKAHLGLYIAIFLKVINGSSGNSGEITASGDEAVVGAVVATMARQCDEWRWQEK